VFIFEAFLIELQTRVFGELQENYKRQSDLDFENAAIGHTNGQQKLYTIKNNLVFLANMTEARPSN
jgi:hypothetical protein